ncbi:WSC-domain-containing protein [Thozetella sp. PMI_491]|nr:WSC-domain-containing protein [Thozetella sp. PMI_491]
MSTATQFLGTPAVGTCIDGWEYLGCAWDNVHTPGPRVLTGAFADGSVVSKMTIDVCEKFCTDRNYTIAGVEYGQQCFCGSTFAYAPQWDPSGCNITWTCTGDSNEICGGFDHISLFRRTECCPSDPAGCLLESVLESIIVNSTLLTHNSMTPDICSSHCMGRNYPYSGVQNGNDCRCATASLNDILKTIDQLVSDVVGTCDVPCAGNTSLTCGGIDALSIYKTLLGGASVSGQSETKK